MRRTYLEKLVHWKNKPNRKPLILKGVRQVGKTYLLQQFGREHFPAFHYLNFEKDNELSKIFEHNLDPKVIYNYDYGSFKGYFAENFIAQEFLYGGESSLYSWSEKNSEIEFLREVDGTIIPVEVKSGWVTQAKSLKVFMEKYRPLYSVIFSAKNLSVNESKDFIRCPHYLANQFFKSKKTL